MASDAVNHALAGFPKGGCAIVCVGQLAWTARQRFAAQHITDTLTGFTGVAACRERGRRIVNSVNSPTRLSTSIVPPCCWVTMS
jgi:hypothetical protein